MMALKPEEKERALLVAYRNNSGALSKLVLLEESPSKLEAVALSLRILWMSTQPDVV